MTANATNAPSAYDPTRRELTPLAKRLRREIETNGPITVEAYMQACLADPDHGYYRARTAIGRNGDFITAPEISQIFGELIGLWALVTWQQMGAPGAVHLVELGPGRGTLMRDALRAARIAPTFLKAANVHLVDINQALRADQETALAGTDAKTAWHENLDGIPGGPTILIANEFLDALPCAQWHRKSNNWYERHVGLEGDALAFVDIPASPSFFVSPNDDVDFEHDPEHTAPPSNAIWMQHDFSELTNALAQRAANASLAALFIDYGHTSHTYGDVLQAVRDHAFEHPLSSPGEADLSVAVDFAQFRNAATQAGLTVDGPTTQAEFLGHLGMVERAKNLTQANPDRAGEIEAAAMRLLSPTGMGTRFKVAGLRRPDQPPLAGLEPSTTGR